MGNSEKLSVIILIHNNIDISRKCLESLAGAVSGFDHEVLLLDNGSTQNTGVLREYGNEFQSFRWIRSNENSSFSIGNNRCAGVSSGRLLLFINNDVFLNRDSVRQLVNPLIEDDRIGATGGKLLFPGEKCVQHAGIGQMLWDHPSNYGVGASPSDHRIQEMCERFALSGAMLCLKREAFENVGGFDERYVWGTEDIDLCLKIRAAGWKAVYCPEATAIHHESATLKINKACDSDNNCRLYRQIWNPVLVPFEQHYVRCLKEQGIRRVAVFGLGSAARGLARILDENDIQITAFTASGIQEAGKCFLGRPVYPLGLLRGNQYDRLIVASQYFFEIESRIKGYDPLHEPIYPLLN